MREYGLKNLFNVETQNLNLATLISEVFKRINAVFKNPLPDCMALCAVIRYV